MNEFIEASEDLALTQIKANTSKNFLPLFMKAPESGEFSEPCLCEFKGRDELCLLRYSAHEVEIIRYRLGTFLIATMFVPTF